MAVYKMIIRDGDNPETNKLHAISAFCNADTKVEAIQLFDAQFGQKWNIAGPMIVTDINSIPKDANFIN